MVLRGIPSGVSVIGPPSRHNELQELVETVAQVHAGLSEVAFKLRRKLTPKGPALKPVPRPNSALTCPIFRSRIAGIANGGSISRTLNPPKGASHCPRFAGESDRRGPATAAEGCRSCIPCWPTTTCTETQRIRRVVGTTGIRGG